MIRLIIVVMCYCMSIKNILTPKTVEYFLMFTIISHLLNVSNFCITYIHFILWIEDIIML